MTVEIQPDDIKQVQILNAALMKIQPDCDESMKQFVLTCVCEGVQVEKQK